MANTGVQQEVENWIRCYWLPDRLRHDFSKQKLSLTPGGVFDFDAVSEDKTIAVSISTSAYRTAKGKPGSGKTRKIQSDMYFLILCDVKHRIVVLTEKDMYEWCMKEKENGRVHESIEFMLVDIPDNLRSRLVSARSNSSDEVSPG